MPSRRKSTASLARRSLRSCSSGKGEPRRPSRDPFGAALETKAAPPGSGTTSLRRRPHSLTARPRPMPRATWKTLSTVLKSWQIWSRKGLSCEPGSACRAISQKGSATRPPSTSRVSLRHPSVIDSASKNWILVSPPPPPTEDEVPEVLHLLARRLGPAHEAHSGRRYLERNPDS
jgi:hypothetical protein